MKANKAPEKLYIESTWRCAFTEKAKANDIEYIRTDAFIEKVLRYLDEYFFFNNSSYSIESKVFDSKKEMLEDFKKYIEEE